MPETPDVLNLAKRLQRLPNVVTTREMLVLGEAAVYPVESVQALAAYVVRREEGIRPVITRTLKKGYGHCTCQFETGAPFIVSDNQRYCPNCGTRLLWGKK